MKKKLLKEDKRMKRKALAVTLSLVLVMLVAVLLLAPWGERKLRAAIGTHADVVLTNTATLTWNSSLTAGATNMSLSVGTNYGGYWYATNGNQNVIAGQTGVLYTIFTNMGNATNGFTFLASMQSATTSQTWSFEFTNFATGAHSHPLTVGQIARADVLNLGLLVTVPIAETNGVVSYFQCMASNAAALSAGAYYYTGFDGTSEYGGNMGRWGAGNGRLWLTNHVNNNTNWVLTVAAATMTLSRDVTYANPAPYAAVGRPVPGALICYKLNYSNTSTTTAQDVTIVDTYPTYVTYRGSSSRMSNDVNPACTFVNYSNAQVRTDALNDDQVYVDTGARQVHMYPYGTATSTPGDVNGFTGGVFFYQTTLD